ncbi:MAG: hypothetical protein A3H27_08535, partial [Acidobacteria bacterium RIFCSPLOWO2_02_FULL_59_13]
RSAFTPPGTAALAALPGLVSLRRLQTRTSSRKILLTGFEVFGSLRVNPAEKIVRRIAESSRRKGESDLIVAVLPTEYARAGHQIRQLIRRVRPKAVLCLGVARSRTAISLERIALNLDDDPLPDNAGRVYTGRHIALAGPLAYASTLPLQRMLQTLRRREIPACISNHAGSFVCNHVFYVARSEVRRRGREIPCGLIHVPAMIGPRGSLGLPLHKMVEAIECCLEVLRRSR